VLESLLIGQEWHEDERIILFVKLRNSLTLTEELEQKIKGKIRLETSPRHVPAKIIQVSDIPRTISGKIVELAVKNIIHNREVKNVDALANPQSLDQFRDLEELKH
jgi:acetoacetyl-CoA synthetase